MPFEGAKVHTKMRCNTAINSHNMICYNLQHSHITAVSYNAREGKSERARKLDKVGERAIQR